MMQTRHELTESDVDAIFLVIGLGFFAAACVYLYACDRL